jgi:hypothetical protein
VALIAVKNVQGLLHYFNGKDVDVALKLVFILDYT